MKLFKIRNILTEETYKMFAENEESIIPIFQKHLKKDGIELSIDQIRRKYLTTFETEIKGLKFL